MTRTSAAEAQNLALARRYIAVLSEGAGPEALEAFLSPDFLQEEFPNRLLPEGATRDLGAVREARVRGRALLSAERFDIVDAVASGERVAMELVWTGVVRAPSGPFSAGQQLRARFAVFLDFRDGRIVRQRNYDSFDPW